MSKYIYSIILFVILSIAANAQEDNIHFKHITNNDGLSSNNIQNIFEDSKGLIWIATNDGLNVYDGATIKYMYREMRVRDIVEDPQNTNLYFSTKDGVMIFNRKKYKITPFSIKNNKGKVLENLFTTTININDKNEIFLAKTNELYIVNPSRTNYEALVFPETKNKTGNRISIIHFCKDGRILIGTPYGLAQLNRKKKQFIPILENYRNVNVKIIFEDSQNNIWVGTNFRGLFCFEGGDFTKKAKYYGVENGLLPNNRPFNMVEIDKDKYYIIDLDGGLVYLNTKTKRSTIYTPDLHNPKSINAKALQTIAKDSKNNIWIGTLKNGINLIDIQQKQFEHYFMNFKYNGLTNNNIRSFCQDYEGNVWVGTDAPGSLSKFYRKYGTFKTYKKDINNPDALHGEYILCIEELDTSRLIIGTLKKGIEIFNKETETFTHINLHEDTKLPNRAYAIKKDTKGNIWISGATELLKFNPTTTTIEAVADIKRSVDIEQADDNHLWITTLYDGLFYFNINTYKYKQYQIVSTDTLLNTKISSNTLSVVKKDSKGNIWIGTTDKGLNFKEKNSDTFTHIVDGLAHKEISDILLENDTTIWISTVKGLSRYDVKTKTFRNYDINDGLQGNQFGTYTALKTKNGEMYFGGRNGFNLFDPKKIVDNPHIPNIILTDFKLFNKSVLIDTLNSPLSNHISETKELTLNHEQSVISFEFAALNYSSPQKNQYAYMLEGFDKEWNYIGNKKEATYTNLPPNEYTFRVKASNNDGKWNETGTSIKLLILPPWWNTWWFKMTAALVILGGSVSFFIIRISKMNERQKELENKVNERTKDLQEANIILEESKEEVSQQNEELEVKQGELLDKNQEIEIKNTILEEQKKYLEEQKKFLKEKNENIKASISYAKTIQNAILPTPHELTNAFNGFVIYQPKDIVSGDFYWINRIDSNTCLVAAVDCTGHGVPGAFMSMIGSRLLNSIVNEQKIHNPKDILHQMNVGVQKALKQSTSNNDDGMDVCLCKIEKNENIKITFSGAKRPLYFFNAQTNIIERLRGSINSIGGNYYLNDHPYLNAEITINKGDCIYLTSDGYIDQNNVARKSFGSRKFNELLLSIANLDAEEQKTKMEGVLNNFMTQVKQRDDITVIGIKF